MVIVRSPALHRALPFLLLLVIGGTWAGESPKLLGYQVVARYPHDPAAFTQGLAWADGRLYESTGIEGRSSLRAVELTTGKVLRSAALRPWQFGEGIAVVGDHILQLTWKSGQALVRERAGFR